MARGRSLLVAEVGELTVLRDRERPSGRLLRQGEVDASYVDLADASHLEFDYLRWMRDLVELAQAHHVVHVGGAGCALARALASLPLMYREALLLVAIEGLRHSEAADICGVTVEAMRQRVSRARTLLARHLTAEEAPMLAALKEITA